MVWRIALPGRGFAMLNRFEVNRFKVNLFKVPAILLLPAVMLTSAALAQNERPQKATGTDQKSGAAPRHDISGTWPPANGPSDGIQANVVKAMPADSKPQHQLPYTPYGMQLFKSHH